MADRCGYSEGHGDDKTHKRLRQRSPTPPRLPGSETPQRSETEALLAAASSPQMRCEGEAAMNRLGTLSVSAPAKEWPSSPTEESPAGAMSRCNEKPAAKAISDGAVGKEPKASIAAKAVPAGIAAMKENGPGDGDQGGDGGAAATGMSAMAAAPSAGQPQGCRPAGKAAVAKAAAEPAMGEARDGGTGAAAAVPAMGQAPGAGQVEAPTGDGGTGSAAVEPATAKAAATHASNPPGPVSGPCSRPGASPPRPIAQDVGGAFTGGNGGNFNLNPAKLFISNPLMAAPAQDGPTSSAPFAPTPTPWCNALQAWLPHGTMALGAPPPVGMNSPGAVLGFCVPVTHGLSNEHLREVAARTPHPTMVPPIPPVAANSWPPLDWRPRPMTMPPQVPTQASPARPMGPPPAMAAAQPFVPRGAPPIPMNLLRPKEEPSEHGTNNTAGLAAAVSASPSQARIMAGPVPPTAPPGFALAGSCYKCGRPIHIPNSHQGDYSGAGTLGGGGGYDHHSSTPAGSGSSASSTGVAGNGSGAGADDAGSTETMYVPYGVTDIQVVYTYKSMRKP